MKIKELQEELDTTKRQISAAIYGAENKKEAIEERISELESQLRRDTEAGKVKNDLKRIDPILQKK